MLGKLFGKGAKEVISAVDEVADKWFESDADRQKFKLQVQQQISEERKAQIELNKVEAQGNAFQKGWRPFIGWICGSAMALKFIILPFLAFFTGWEVPVIEWQEISVVLMSMLGLGGLRTYEKMKGKAR